MTDTKNPADSPGTTPSLNTIDPLVSDEAYKDACRDAYDRGYQDAMELIRAKVEEEFRSSHGHFSLTCAKCGHAGEMVRSHGTTTAVTGFKYVRVFRNGTVAARCQQCSANQAIAAERLPDPEKLQ